MKIRMIALGAVLLMVVLMAGPVQAEEMKALKRLEANPADTGALAELSLLYNLPPASVWTRIKADRAARSISRLNPQEDLVFTAAGLYEAVGQYAEARRVVGWLVAQRASWRGSLQMAWEYYLEGKLLEALRWYEQAIGQAPDQLDPWHGKMLTLLGMGRVHAAAGVGHYILRRDPRNPTANLRLGNIYYQARDYSTARQFYSRAQLSIDGRLGMGLCLHKLGQDVAARPHLLAAFTAYPKNPDLLAALKEINEAEIRSLEREIPVRVVRGTDQVAVKGRLAYLYEVNGHYLKAAELLRGMFPARPGFDELLRVANLYSSGGKLFEAGKYYEAAAAVSPNPRLTRLAAVDSYLGSDNLARAELLLQWLANQGRGLDLDLRFASLYSKKGDLARARKTWLQIGSQMESQARGDPNPRDTMLRAVDAYLDGKGYGPAEALLTQAAAQSRDYYVDLRLSRLFFETDRFHQAVEIYEKYPAVVPMQVSRGWALSKLGHRKEARRAFLAVMEKVPGHAGARAGLDYVDNVWNWDLFLLATRVDYGDYQDPRFLTTEVMKYIDRRAVTTVSHTKTDIPSLTPGNVDFNEDLLGLRCYYLFRPRLAGQLHLLHFENDDPTTDHANVYGGRFFYFPNPEWTVDLEVDRSDYPIADAIQLNLHAGYQFHPKWRADLTTILGRVDGPWENSRAGTQGHSGGVKASLGYAPHRRVYLNLTAFGGDRLLNVDSEGMFAYNIPDRYRSAVSFFGTYRFAPWVKTYLSFASARFESDWQTAANQKAGAILFDPTRQVSSVTLGSDFSF